MEERQKHAIDVLYDLLPERYETASRRKKLRKLFHEEAAFKSQFYAVWALNTFGALRTRVMNASSRQKIASSDYLDPVAFMIDNSNALLKLNNDLIANTTAASVTGSLKVAGSIKDSLVLIADVDADSSRRDVSEFLSSVMSGAKTQDDIVEKLPNIGNEFIESIANIFDKFKISTVRFLSDY